MMAPPPAQPYGYGVPAAYGAPPPQPYGMPAAPPPAAPAPVWPPAGRARCPGRADVHVLPETDGAAAGRAGGPAARGYAAPARAEPGERRHAGGYDDDFFSSAGHVRPSQPVRRGSAMSVARVHRGRRQRAADAAAAGSWSLKYTVTFDSETKLGMLLSGARPRRARRRSRRARETVVTMVIEGGAAQKGVAVGSRLLLINGQDATALPYARCLELVKSLPRPLHLVFEKSMAACDSAKGWVLVKKSAGSGPPSSMAGWQRMFFVVGGAVAKRHVLQLYSSKAQYEDIVVRMFQGQPLTGMVQGLRFCGTFKCSAIQSKVYKGDTTGGNQFANLPDEDGDHLVPVHRRRALTIARFATKGAARRSPSPPKCLLFSVPLRVRAIRPRRPTSWGR